MWKAPIRYKRYFDKFSLYLPIVGLACVILAQFYVIIMVLWTGVDLRELPSLSLVFGWYAMLAAFIGLSLMWWVSWKTTRSERIRLGESLFFLGSMICLVEFWFFYWSFGAWIAVTIVMIILEIVAFQILQPEMRTMDKGK